MEKEGKASYSYENFSQIDIDNEDRPDQCLLSSNKTETLNTDRPSDDTESNSDSETDQSDLKVLVSIQKHDGLDTYHTPSPTICSQPLLPKQVVLHHVSKAMKQESRIISLSRILERVQRLIYLAVFGILGVITRYLLEVLFAPGAVGLTNDQTILYLDLPPNMAGSFLMGWLGVVFKQDISWVSSDLSIGISTGYLGSLTTFSNWNQVMIDLSLAGHWAHSLLGFLLGLFLVAYSIIIGIESAKGFRWLLSRGKITSRSDVISKSQIKNNVDSDRCQFAIIVLLMLVLSFLWGMSGSSLKEGLNSGSRKAQLWLACMVAPIGVWIRWLLAQLNGRGLGRKGLFQWFPFGTLIANFSAACIMAALSAAKEKKAEETTYNSILSGIQFGLLGSLSTVSTFMAEFNALRESEHPWRGYAYFLITVCLSCGFGMVIHFTPGW